MMFVKSRDGPQEVLNNQGPRCFGLHARPYGPSAIPLGVVYDSPKTTPWCTPSHHIALKRTEFMVEKSIIETARLLNFREIYEHTRVFSSVSHLKFVKQPKW